MNKLLSVYKYTIIGKDLQTRGQNNCPKDNNFDKYFNIYWRKAQWSYEVQ